MTLDEMIQAMGAAGCSGEQIAAASAYLNSGHRDLLEKKREQDRIRSARYRARHKSSRVETRGGASRGVAGCGDV